MYQLVRGSYPTFCITLGILCISHTSDDPRAMFPKLLKPGAHWIRVGKTFHSYIYNMPFWGGSVCMPHMSGPALCTCGHAYAAYI